MQNGGFLLAAFAVVWSGSFVYILFLSARQARLRQEINALKERLEEKETK